MVGTDAGRTRAAGVLLALAALAYCGLLWEALAGYPLAPSTSYLSELAASDQPLRWVFRSGDLLAGVLVTAAGCLALGVGRRAAQRDRWTTVAVLALLAFGTGTVLDALLPMRCAPSASRACASADASGTLGAVHDLHTVTSTVAVTSVTVLALCLVLLGTRGAPQEARRPWVAGVGLAAVVATVTVALLSARAELGGGPIPGLAQRVQTVTFCLVLLAVVPALAARWAAALRGAPRTSR